MNIFVTGGSGFIGSNFILKTFKDFRNCKILNFDKLTYAGNNNNLLSIEENVNYNFIRGDICDIKKTFKTIFNFSPDVVVNFAAESHVDRSIDNPHDFVNTNVLGTVCLLDAVNKYIQSNEKKGFKFIHISTDEVYGSLDFDGFFDEKSPYQPNSPYSASKASSDHFVRSWGKTFGLPYVITNCSNNYGPYQFPEKLIPLIIANCLDDKPLPIYGKGTNIRDWLFVEDHCDAIIKILKSNEVNETFSIGGNNEITNIEIVNLICKIMDKIRPLSNRKYSQQIKFVKDRPGHDFRYAINPSKIKRRLNWKPNVSFKDGIEKTIKWYLKNENWWRSIQKKSYNQERLGTIRP